MILCGSWWTTPVRWSPEWNPPFIPFNGGSLFSNLWRFCHCIWFYTAGVDLLWEQSNSLVNILPRLTSPPLTEEHWYRFTKTNKGRYESRHSSFSQAYDQPRQYIKKQRHNSANKGPSSQIYVFPVVMWGCESWTIKKAECQRRNQSWIFIGGNDAEAETPILWPPDVKNWFILKDPDAGKNWRQEEKGTTDDEMVVWHHRLNEHEFK